MTEASGSHRRGFYKRAMGWGILFVIIFIPASHFLWGIWAANRLNAALAALHAAGEPITAAQLKLDSVPDAQNASLDYRAAGDSIDTTTAIWKPYNEGANGSFRVPLTESERAAVHAIVQENPTALARVAAARGKMPGGWDDRFTNPDMLTTYHLNGRRNLSNLLKFAALDAHASGDDPTALRWLGDALSEAEASEHRPTLIGHLVAVGCIANSCDGFSELAPELRIGSDRLQREQILEVLQKLQDESAMNEGIKLSWRSERIVAVNTMRELAGGTLFSPTSTGVGGSFPTASRAENYAIKPLALTDARMYANYLQGVLAAQTAPDWFTAQARMPKELLAQLDAHPFEHLFLRILVPGVERAGQVDYRAKTERRMAVVALAIRLYAADHNDQLPPSLADLVPGYLRAIPNDAMVGGPLRYKSDPPRIYGLGEDGVDYGGVPKDPDSPDKVRRRHGDLVVYLVTQPRKASTATTEMSPGVLGPGAAGP